MMGGGLEEVEKQLARLTEVVERDSAATRNRETATSETLGRVREEVHALVTAQKATLEAVNALKGDVDAALYRGYQGRPALYEELRRAHTRIDPLEKWSGVIMTAIILTLVGALLGLVILRPGQARAVYPPAKEKPSVGGVPRALVG
jgi:hypothetical protein